MDFRTLFLMELVKSGMDENEIRNVLMSFDRISGGWTMQRENTEIMCVEHKWQTCLQAYICSRSVEGLSDKTLKSSGMVIRRFFHDIHVDIDHVDTMTVRAWLYNRHVTNATMENYRNRLKSFFEWCVNEGYIENNPLKRIPVIKTETKLQDYLTRMEVEQIRSTFTDARTRAVFEFLLSTGCRCSELCGIRLSDFRDDGSIVVHGKGNKQRLVYLTPRAKIDVDAYLKTRKDQCPYLFIAERGYPRAMTKEAVELIFKTRINANHEIGKKITPHTMRRTYATLSLNQGCPINVISKMLGHANIAVTERYAQTSDEQIKQAHYKYVV